MRPVCLVLLLVSVQLFSCVSGSKLKAVQQQAAQSDSLYRQSQASLKTCQDANTDLVRQKNIIQDQFDVLNKQVALTKENNDMLLKQLNSLSAISSSQAESIQKSMDNIGAKDRYIQEFRKALSHRDSANMTLIMSLKGEIGGLEGREIFIRVEKGVAIIEMTDSLLFDSAGSYNLTDRGRNALGKLAIVLKDQPDMDFTVEGNADSVTFAQGLQDSWDISVKRATTIVKVLQDYNVPALRITAAGRGAFNPIAPNDTPQGQETNRRTSIVITPQLDHFFELLDRKGA
jgi:chemotaxis protein MotB